MVKKAAKKRKYSRSSGSDVKSEMRRYKRAPQKAVVGQGRKSQKPQTGDSHRPFKGPQEGQEGPEKTNDKTQDVSVVSLKRKAAMLLSLPPSINSWN